MYLKSLFEGRRDDGPGISVVSLQDEEDSL